jgi:hypothetical protein
MFLGHKRELAFALLLPSPSYRFLLLFSPFCLRFFDLLRRPWSAARLTECERATSFFLLPPSKSWRERSTARKNRVIQRCIVPTRNNVSRFTHLTLSLTSKSNQQQIYFLKGDFRRSNRHSTHFLWPRKLTARQSAVVRTTVFIGLSLTPAQNSDSFPPSSPKVVK